MLRPTRKPIRKSAATSSQVAGQTRRGSLPPPRKPIHSARAEQIDERDVLERHRDADLGPVEEEVGDAEAEQEEQVEVRDPAQPAPVDQAEQEDRAEGEEDVGRVELVAEGAGVAARHLPGDLVAGPGLAHDALAGSTIDQRHLLVVGEVGDLPVAVDLVGAVGQRRVLGALLDRLGVVGGDSGSLRRALISRAVDRGRSDQAGCKPRVLSRAGGPRAVHGPSSTPLPHATRGEVLSVPLRPKCSTRSVRRRGVSTGPARQGRRGRSRRRGAGRASRRRCREPWLPPPAWVTPPQSTAS